MLDTYASFGCCRCQTGKDRAVQFAKFQEMQRLFRLEKAAWEEQHNGGSRTFNPASAFTLNSVVGSVRNVLRGTGSFLQQQQSRSASMDAQVMPEDGADVIAVPDVDMYIPPVSPIPVWTE